MKTITIALAASFCAFGLLGQDASESPFRKIKLENPEFAIPADNGVVGWGVYNRDWPGKVEVKDGEKEGKCLVITPLPSPTQKDKSGPIVQVLVTGSPDFTAAVGDKIKIEFEFRLVDAKTSGGPMLNGPALSHWLPSFKAMKPKIGEWTKYSSVYTLKELRDKIKGGKYTIGFCVANSSVEIRNVALSLQKQKD